MLRTLAATALGLSLALTPLATAPAHALDDRQAAGIVAGAIILGLGAALAQNGTVGVQVQPPRHYQRRAYDPYPGYGQHRLDRARILPGSCLRRVKSRQGTFGLFGPNCLARAGVNVRHLPRQCATEIRVGGRYRPAYGARCLQHNGWRVARRY